MDFKKYIFITTFILLCIFPTATQASTLQPAISDYTMDAGSTDTKSVIYTNSTTSREYLDVLVAAYNAQDGTMSESLPVFVTPSETNFEVSPLETYELHYDIDIPADTASGTYFNVIAVIPKETDNADSVSLEIGGGVIIAVHVKGKDIEEFTLRNMDVNSGLSVERWGLSGLFDSKVELTIHNPSQFVLNPTGEIRAIDKDGRIIASKQINTDADKLYPDTSYEVEFVYDIPLRGDIDVVYEVGDMNLEDTIQGSFTIANYSLTLYVGVVVIVVIIGFIGRVVFRRLKKDK